jgi:hypothetical protein
MNFEWLVSALIYIVLSNFLVGALPSDLFGVAGTSDNPDFTGLINESAKVSGSVVKEMPFLFKVARYFFAPWTIAGIPGLIAALLVIVNVVSILIPVVWIYDKIRGIS